VRIALGRWLFQNRGWTPLPLLVAEFTWAERQQFWFGLGVLFVGEALRLWAVGHIGSRSRTRGDAVGDLETGGPFGRLRNPLYLGNGLIALSLGLWGGGVWIAVWCLFFTIQYTLIVQWEESVLLPAIGPSYQSYCEQVPRWLPVGRMRSMDEGASWSLPQAFRSERATLLSLSIVGLGFWMS
jgi:protein-S-isoprenylcysteine O-methyltransferase Ste14